jgi:UDP-N-acetylglucosamine 4-epimerase
VTKLVNEHYADVFASTYGFKTIGLRYFNVFGPRQDPHGAYAAVIPKWADAMLRAEPIYVNGDGSTSRDFCFVDNTVQANLLAATAAEGSKNQVYNVAVGDRETLSGLFEGIRGALEVVGVKYSPAPIYRDFRVGDVLHSQASIKKISEGLGYCASHNLAQGLCLAMPWYRTEYQAGR